MQRPSWAQGALMQRPSLRGGLPRPEIFTGCRARLCNGPQDPHARLVILSRDPHPVQGSTIGRAFVLCRSAYNGDPHAVQTSARPTRQPSAAEPTGVAYDVPGPLCSEPLALSLLCAEPLI